MRSKTILFGLVVLALAGGTAWATEAGAEAAEPPTPFQQVTLEAFLDSLAPVADATVCESEGIASLDLLGQEAAAAGGSCPYGAPRCFRDKHCDAYCGGKGFGVCDDQTHCCLCAG